MTRFRNRAILVVAASTLIAACGGGGGDETAGTTPATTAPAAPGTTAPGAPGTTAPAAPGTTAPDAAGAGVVGSFDAAQPAVVQIIAQGSFRDPEIGTFTGAGAGSGFFISDDGLVVTNNHVVTGAATLEVFIGGDTSKSYNATFVGVSECNDLALIKVDVDEPTPYFEWAAEKPTVGLEIYSAGFPLGDPEYTMTRGIIAKADAFGDTPWASIDSTVEHDANTQGGNSGGPILSAEGKVVAVHYASSAATNQSQFFAIEATLAKAVVEQLRDGDFESLGINGSVVVDEEAGIAGVWVSGTAPGSPASEAGILPGDIVTAMNGLPVGTDGTMKDYCDVIRTAGDTPIKVEVLRFDTQEVLEGEINGTQPLQQVFSFAEEIEEEIDVEVDPAAPAGYSQYQTLVDDLAGLTVDVPVEWSDVDTAPFVFEDGTQSPYIAAATSLSGFFETYETPGMVMTKLPAVAPADIPGIIEELAASSSGGCAVDNGLTDYDDGIFVGQYQLWSDCGGVGAVYVGLVVNSINGVEAVAIGVQVVSDADFEALDAIFNSFNVLGS